MRTSGSRPAYWNSCFSSFFPETFQPLPFLFLLSFSFLPKQNSLLLDSILESRAPELWLCGWALCPGPVLLLSSSWPDPEFCQLCGWAVWLGSVARPDIRSRKPRSQRALQRERRRKINLKSEREQVLWSLSWPRLVDSAAGLCGPAYWRGVWPNK